MRLVLAFFPAATPHCAMVGRGGEYHTISKKRSPDTIRGSYVIPYVL